MKNAETNSVIWKISAVALAASLVACGGGGGSDNGGSSPEPTVSETPFYVLSGNAIKGAMNKAKAMAYKVNSDGIKGDALGEAITDSEGQYSINVSNYTGVVLVEVVATADTTMLDEATGGSIKPAVGFTLRASVASPSGTGAAKTLALQVNPMTEMAVAATAKLAGGLSLANVEKANSDLVASLGFNPTADKPAFSNGVPTNKAAVMLAAVSYVAKADDLTACASASDQAAKVKCVVEQMASGGLANAAVTAALENRIAVVAEKAGADASIVPAIKPPTSSSTLIETTALDQAKAFIGTVRSNAKALDAADMSLKTELQAVSDEMQNTVAPASQQTADIMQLAMLGAQLWNDLQKPGAPLVLSRTFYADGNFRQPLGSCTMYSDNGFNTRSTTKVDALYVSCGTQPTSLNSTSSGTGFHAWNVRVRIFPDAAGADKFTVYTVTRDAMYVLSATTYIEDTSASVQYGDLSNKSSDGKKVLGNKATLTATRNAAGAVNAFAYVGEMSPGYEINNVWVPGTGLPGSYGRYDTTAKVLGEKLKVDMAATWTVDAAGLSTVGFKGYAEHYNTVNAVSQLQSRLDFLEGTSITGQNFDPANGVSSQVIGNPSSYIARLNLKFSRGSSSLTGMLTASDLVEDATKTNSSAKVVFAGSVERNGTKFFDGSVTVDPLNFSSYDPTRPTSANNVLSKKATVKGAVVIKDRPTLNVDLVVSSVDKGSVWTNALSGQYRQGASVINILGTGGSAKGSVTLDSSTGVKLVVDSGKTEHPLTKSGFPVGTFNETTKRLTYTDGTFEQF